MSDISTPLSVQVAGETAVAMTLYGKRFELLNRSQRGVCEKISRAVLDAALSTWPGMVDHPENAISPRCLWLPLMENGNDQA